MANEVQIEPFTPLNNFQHNKHSEIRETTTQSIHAVDRNTALHYSVALGKENSLTITRKFTTWLQELKTPFDHE